MVVTSVSTIREYKAIDSNLGGVINQNIGYVGAEKNSEPLTVIDDSQ